MMNPLKIASDVKWNKKIPIATFDDSVIPPIVSTAKNANSPIVERIIGMDGIK